MPSIQSRLFVFALKHRHLLRFQGRRTTLVDSKTLVDDLRAEVERGAGFFGKLPADFEVAQIRIGQIYAEWMRPISTASDRAILYFHGGGLVVGSVNAHRGIVAKFVKASRVGALTFDYRLAPEHPYPAGLTDCVAAYQHLLGWGIKPGNIAFMGDSGGGCLVFSTMLALKEQGLPLPAAAVALSPWTDLANSGESWTFNAKADTLSWKEAQNVFSQYYVGDQDPALPLISPLFGDLRGQPPILIYVGGDETLLSDSTRFAEKAGKAGVNVTLRVGKGLFHCYPACAPMFPEASEALDEISAFIRKHTNNQKAE